jgi:hypothetical protein
MKFLITSIAVLILSSAAFAQENEVFTYLTITQYGNELSIGIGEGEFETINVKEERNRGNFDHRPLLKRISEFEKQGWELISTEFLPHTTGADIIMYAFMRKEI